MAVGFTFSFICFSSLSAFLQEFPLPFASVFPDCPSFCFAGRCVVTCGSPLLPFRLVCSCFETSLPSLRFVCMGRIFSRWVFSTLLAFVFSSFPSESQYYYLASVCKLLLVASPSPSFIEFLFSFCIHRSRVRGFVACLPASLSFRFLVLFRFFRRRCFSSSGGFLQFPGFVC